MDDLYLFVRQPQKSNFNYYINLLLLLSSIWLRYCHIKIKETIVCKTILVDIKLNTRQPSDSASSPKKT